MNPSPPGLPVADPQPGQASVPRGNRFMAAIALGAIALLGCMQLFISLYLIPQFASIYRDFVVNRPLPTVSTMVLGAQWLLVALSIGLPLAALYLFRRPTSVRWLCAILAAQLLQITFIVVALYLPLNGIVHGMQEAAPGAN